MRAAILEIRDGIATGPLHQPVPVIGRNTTFDDEAVDWPTLCGVRGHAYQRAALAKLGHTTECFECALVALTPPKPKRKVFNPGPQKYDTDLERMEARRLAWRSYYQRGRRRGTCMDCQGPTSCNDPENPPKRCRTCHNASVRAQHGTRSLYVKGCRCDGCRDAQSQYQRQRRAA